MLTTEELNELFQHAEKVYSSQITGCYTQREIDFKTWLWLYHIDKIDAPTLEKCIEKMFIAKAQDRRYLKNPTISAVQWIYNNSKKYRIYYQYYREPSK